jgi:hypothetical protein
MRTFQQAEENGFNEDELCPFCGGEPHRHTLRSGGFDETEKGCYRCGNCGACGAASTWSWKNAWENWIMRKKLPEKFIVVTNMDDHEHASFETVEEFDRKERAVSFFENMNSKNCVEKTLYRATVIVSAKKY